MELIYRGGNYNVDSYEALSKIVVVYDDFIIVENGVKNSYYSKGSGYHKTVSKNQKVVLSFVKIGHFITIDNGDSHFAFTFYNNGNMEFSYSGGGFSFAGDFADYIHQRIVRKNFLWHLWNSWKPVLSDYLDRDSQEYRQIIMF